LIICFGRHRCASTWLAEILIDVSRDLGLQFGYVHNEESFGGDIGRHVQEKGIGLLVFANAQRSYLTTLPPYRGFHVIRDPRDQLVSAYFSHRDSHVLQPWLEEQRAALRAVDHDAGLHLEMDFFIMEFILGQLRDWDFNNPRILELRFEEVTLQPERALRGAFEFVGLFERGLSTERFQSIVQQHAFEAKSGGRIRGQIDEKSHYRRGVAGDWRNHFTAEHVEHFKRKYNDLLLGLGYETKEDWSL